MTGLIVQEWLARNGGSERVVEQLLETFPDADLQVLWNDAPEQFASARESWLARTPLRRSKALALPVMPITWRHLHGSRDYDWLLVSSHLFAHHARLSSQPDIPKLVYAHTPARYIWEPDLDTRGDTLVARLASQVLRPLDRRRAQDAVEIVANSRFTRDRISRTWQRDARVIYPPVATDRIISGGNWLEHLSADEADIVEALPETFLLGASRFVSYKRLDVVIDAGAAAGLPIVLAGGGPEEAALRAKAALSPTPVYFVSAPSTPLLYALYQRALALIFPAIEDFGIMPVEAMAAGTPVIVAPVGGAAEVVSLTGGGAIMPTTESTADWTEVVTSVSLLDREAVSEGATRFSSARFRSEIADWVRRTVDTRPS